MSRTLNPRRVLFAKMSEAKQWLGFVTQVWNAPPSLRWFADEPGGDPCWHREPRRRHDIPAGEYQENNPELLRQLITYCRAVSVRMDEVIELAEQRLAELKVSA